MQLGIDLAKSVGVTVQKADIDRAHRIGQKGKKTASGELIHRRKLKDAKPPRIFSLQGKDLKRIFITDNLTRKNQKVMFRARELRRSGALWAAWSDGCQMKVKIREGGATHKIKTEADLEKLIGQ